MLLGRNLEILGAKEDLSKIVRVPEGEGGVVDCSCYGLYFASRQSLNMHFNSRHPEIHQLSKQKFDRVRHSLFGLPVCRFCRERQFSWQVLSQHISYGMCPVVKDGVGRGLAFVQILERMLQRESIDPPLPPAGASQVFSAPPMNDAAYAGPLSIVLKNASKVRLLLDGCALCSQRMQRPNRLKTHWRQTHPKAWALVEVPSRSGAQSINSVLETPCQFCGSAAKDRRAHSVQCPAFFRLLSVRELLRRNLTTRDLEEEKPEAKRQSERRSAYKDFSLSTTGIAKAFAKSRPTVMPSSSSQVQVASQSGSPLLRNRSQPCFYQDGHRPRTQPARCRFHGHASCDFVTFIRSACQRVYSCSWSCLLMVFATCAGRYL